MENQKQSCICSRKEIQGKLQIHREQIGGSRTTWAETNLLVTGTNLFLYPELGLTTLTLYFIQASEQQKTLDWGKSLCYWNMVLDQKCLIRIDRCGLLVTDTYLWMLRFIPGGPGPQDTSITLLADTVP